MGANVPLIVSDTDTNRRLFPQGAIITGIDRTGIKTSLEQFLQDRGTLLEGIIEMKTYWDQSWEKAFLGLENRLAIGRESGTR